MKDNRRLLIQVFVICFALYLANGFSYYGNYYSSSQYGGYPSRSGYRTYRNTDISRRGFWCSYVVMRNTSCTVSYLDRVIEKFNYDCTKYNNKRKYCSGYRSQFVTRYKTEHKLQPTTVTRCCPGFNGPLCDQECFNCTVIKNLLQEIEAIKRDQRTLAQVQVQRGKIYKPVVDFPATEPKGQKGSQGDLGPPGKPGKPGDVGPQGPRGAVGPRGFKGIKGDPGPMGSSGKVGPKGEKGESGVAGPPGPPGYTIQISPDNDFRELKRDGRDIVVGPKGMKGEEGHHGLKGEKGDPGDYITGHRGPRGPPGISIKGEPGPEGKKGDMGPPGLPGQVIHSSKGQRPIPGLPGIPGVHGDKGEKGEVGQRGPKGSSGVSDEIIKDMKNEIDALKKIVGGIQKNCRCAAVESNLQEDLFVIN